MRLVNDDQTQLLETDSFIVQPVVQRLDHCHKTPIVVFFFQFFDLAVDDFVGNADVREHPGRLSAQFNSVGEDQHPIARFEDVPLGEFRKNHGFPPSSGQLEQQIVILREFLHARHEALNRIFLIAIKAFPACCVQVGFQRGFR